MEFVEYRRHNRTALVTMNRPAVLNAIHPPMMREFQAAIRQADEDDEIQVIVVTGNGRSFGAGYDLKYDWDSERGTSPFDYRTSLKRCLEFEMSPWECGKPTIAMVRGHCLGASCELALLCCMTFAAEDAIFGEPEIRFSAPAPAVILPWLTGVKKAKELLYSGDSFDAATALSLGLVNRVYSGEALESETLAFADRIANVSPEALRLTKAAVNRGQEMSGLRTALQYGTEVDAIVYSSRTSIYKEFFGKADAGGLKSALTWLDEKFK